MAEVEDTVKAVEDVLNDGPLVLPWLVGLKENAVKKSGKKYKEILGANIENLCHIFQRLLVNGFVIHIPRNALGVTQGCIVYLGLMKMYYLKLGNFKGLLDANIEKLKCHVPVAGDIDAKRGRATRARLDLPSHELERDSNFGGTTMDEFDRIHRPLEISDPVASVAPAVVEELDFDMLFEAEQKVLRELQRMKRKQDRKKTKTDEGFNDDKLMEMLRANPNVVNVSDITISDDNPAPTRLHDMGFGDEFGDGFGDGLGDGGMIPEFQQERHATIEPLVPQPMETQPFVLEAPSCEQQPVVPEAEEEMPEETNLQRMGDRQEDPGNNPEDGGPPKKRGRAKKIVRTGFWIDDEDALIIAAPELRARLEATEVQHIDELIQEARLQRASLVRLSPRKGTLAQQKRLLATRRIPVGATLTRFLDEIQEKMWRAVLRQKKSKRNASVGQVNQRDPVQDEFDAHVEGVAEQGPQLESTGFEIPHAEETVTNGLVTAEETAPNRFVTAEETATTGFVTAIESPGSDMISARKGNESTPAASANRASTVATSSRSDTMGVLRDPETTPALLTPSVMPAQQQLGQSSGRPDRENDAAEEYQTGIEISYQTDEPMALEPPIADGIQEAAAPSREKLPYRTFSQLFPPQTTYRSKAANEFLRLLHMQKEKKILLIQNTYCGDIWVKPVQ